MPLDKQAHFLAGAVIALALGYLMHPLYGVVVAVAAGALKELYDTQHPDTHTRQKFGTRWRPRWAVWPVEFLCI